MAAYETSRFSFLNSTTLSDADATKMGLKQYLADKAGGANDITYNSGNKATIGLGTAVSSITTVNRCILIPYQTQDGTWRLKINFRASVSTTSNDSHRLSINGVTFKNISNEFQSGHGGFENNTFLLSDASVDPNANTFFLIGTTGSPTVFKFGGDFELDSKPTWAY